MKKNNGFTITELLAVIVILAVLTVIAVSSYHLINKRMKQTALENKISYIETKSANFADETGFLVTNVDQLVKLGYISADNETGDVINPVDKSRMNCHIVNILNMDNNWYAEYTDNEECDINALKKTNTHLGIHLYKTIDNVTKGEEVESNTWVKENIILEAYLKDENVNTGDVQKITWVHNAGREERIVNNNFNEQNKYLVSAEQIVNTTYSAIVELKDGTIFQEQIIVKIDKQRPILYTEEIKIEKEKEWYNKDKEVTIVATDGNGSGIYGYYFGESNKCTEVSYEENHENVYKKALDVGTYYICVKDNVGNVSEDISTRKIEIIKVDKEVPKCQIEATGSQQNGNWYATPIQIKFSSKTDQNSDGSEGSGIKETIIENQTRDTYTITEGIGSRNIKGVVIDQAGNIGECPLEINVDDGSSTTTVCGGYGSCSEDCGGIKTRSCSINSTTGSGFVFGHYSDSATCNTGSCGSSSSGTSGCATPTGPCHYEGSPEDWYCESYCCLCDECSSGPRC